MKWILQSLFLFLVFAGSRALAEGSVLLLQSAIAAHSLAAVPRQRTVEIFTGKDFDNFGEKILADNKAYLNRNEKVENEVRTHLENIFLKPGVETKLEMTCLQSVYNYGAITSDGGITKFQKVTLTRTTLPYLGGVGPVAAEHFKMFEIDHRLSAGILTRSVQLGPKGDTLKTGKDFPLDERTRSYKAEFYSKGPGETGNSHVNELIPIGPNDWAYHLRTETIERNQKTRIIEIYCR